MLDSYQDIIDQYNRLKQQILSQNILKVSSSQLHSEQNRCEQLLDQMTTHNDYQHFEEIVNIQEQYKMMKNTLQEGNAQNRNDQETLKMIRKILQPHNNLPNISSISDIRSEDVAIPEQSKTLQDFFRKKDTEIKQKSVSFKRILDSKEFQSNPLDPNKDLSKHSRFSKSKSNFKPDQKQTKLKQIIDQHKKSLAQLQLKMKQEEELNDFQKNLLREEKNRYLSKIQQLQEEVEQLYRDNYRLKEMQKTTQKDSFNMSDLNEKSSLANAYQPYTIKTRNNDLNKINEKNIHLQEQKAKKQAKLAAKQAQPAEQDEENNQYDMLGEKLETEKPITARDFFRQKSSSKGLYQEKFPEKKEEEEMVLKALLGESFEQKAHNTSRANESMGSLLNGTHFDTFHMARTLSYINDSALGESRNMMRITGQVSTRNKVAFFKNSLVLVRDPNFDIAYKKSQMNEKLDKIRIILYINNKSSTTKRVSINYQYQHQYFHINIQEQINQVQPKSQGREVLEVTLISKTDLNGVTDMHVEVGDARYDLWLPINFIKFKNSQNHHMPPDIMEMTVLPDRQFSNFHNLQQIVPVMFGGTDSIQTWAYLYGQSKFGSYPIKLTWRMRDLQIQASQKWLDFIGFIFHFFK